MKPSSHLRNAVAHLDNAIVAVRSGVIATEEDVAAVNALLSHATIMRNTMVKRDLDSGMLGKDVATRYGLHRTQVSNIKLHGTTY